MLANVNGEKMDFCYNWAVALVLMQGIKLLDSSGMKANRGRCVQTLGGRCLYVAYPPKMYARQNTASGPSVATKKPPAVSITRLEPIRSNLYNPNIGFEPYWPGGDWVFVKTTSPNTDPNATTGRPCLFVCTKAYKNYGVICARNKLRESRTFDDYCELVFQDCANRLGWYIAHRGTCRAELPLFYTYPSSLSTPFLALINASDILERFSKRYMHMLEYTTAPPNRTSPTTTT